MTCEEVLVSIEAFMASELDAQEAGEIADHLATCPACLLVYEETCQLAEEIHHARGAIRPLHSFDLATLPIVTRQRRPRALWAAAAVLGAWMLFATIIVFWPSLAAQVTLLPVGRQLSTTGSAAALQRGALASSLSDVPQQALLRVTALLSSGPGLSTAHLLGIGGPGTSQADIRAVQLGPVVSASAQQLRLSASVDITQGPRDGNSVQHLHVVVTLVRRADGNWIVTNVVRTNR